MSGVSFALGGGGRKPPAGKVAFGLKATAKPKAPVFEPGSDGEEDEGPLAAKRRRTEPVDEGPVPPPEDAEVRKVAERLAEFVAKNGRSFEDITKQRNSANSPFWFLYNQASKEYRWYNNLVSSLENQAAGKSQGGPEKTDAPAPPPSLMGPPQDAGGQRAMGPLGLPPGEAEREAERAKSALKGGDSLAAMEAFTALAAKQDRTRLQREAKVELLNETSFDRRRQVAVYKQDGGRGHHMQDFIPPEELAALLAKSGNEAAQAQAKVVEEAQRIGADNIGHRMLRGMGWQEGQGLGASASGIAAPVSAAGQRNEKAGLGTMAHGEVEAGDDEFEVYRKRMMLGYKHRPNPLGNPRKSYY